MAARDGSMCLELGGVVCPAEQDVIEVGYLAWKRLGVILLGLNGREGPSQAQSVDGAKLTLGDCECVENDAGLATGEPEVGAHRGSR